MNLKIISGAFFALVCFQADAQKKVDRQYFISLLNEGNYQKVFDSALVLRKEVYGKNAVVDYFIAKSLCLDGHKKSATICFNKIISNFKLEGNKKDFIEKEISTCNEVQDAEVALTSANPDYSYISNIALPEASVGGKMGKVYDCFSGNQTINLTRMVSSHELESRLFPIHQKGAAVRKIRSIVGDQYRIDTARRYVFVTSKKFPLTQVNEAANRLERAYQFFIEYYGLRPPDKLLTVYILGDQKTLRQTAELVHGIELPLPNIGYSNLSDLSLLGLGDAKHLGTLYHELFHLLIRTDVGDIPAFLDEGLASLYSVSSWKNNQLIGDYRPWRLEELKEARSSRDRFLQIPSLSKLIGYSWDEFDGGGTKNICQVAVNYALSNFLLIYLQEKKLLQLTVNAYKNRPFVPFDSGNVKTNLRIFEEVVKEPVDTFSRKFEDWFRQRYQFNLFRQNEWEADTYMSMDQKFEQARSLLYNVDENVYKGKDRQEIVKLQSELDSLHREFSKLPRIYNHQNENAPANMVEQKQSISPAEIKRNEIEQSLLAYEKKLRKLIFDNSPKKAN